MKKKIIYLILAVLVVAFALPSTVLAKGLSDDKVVFGGSYTLKSGDTLQGSLIVFGGNATLEEDTNVEGDVVLMGGTVEANGKIEGNILAIGGLVELKEQTLVEGDVVIIGAHLDRAEGARIEGEVMSPQNGPLTFTFPGGVRVPEIKMNFSPVWSAMWFLLRVFLWAGLAVLVAIFFPIPLERAGQAATSQPLVAGGLGLLTAIVAPAVLIVLIITILLIPVSLVGIVLLVLAWFFGVMAIGTEVGRRFAQTIHRDWPLPVASGVGTFVLVLVTDGVRMIVPCVGWVIPALVGMVGLGAVLLTRFGSQHYPPGNSPIICPESAPALEKSPDIVESSVPEEKPFLPETTKKRSRKS